MIPFAVLAVLMLILLARTGRRAKSVPHEKADLAELPPVEKAADHLRCAVGFQTVVHDEMTDWEPFRKLAAWLEQTYPLLHKEAFCTLLEGYTRVYYWKGTDSSLEPVLCTAHQDVVPQGDEQPWTHPPFSGIIDQGYLWGRGSLDMKAQMTALLESVEHLMQSGYRPRRDTYIVLGHDEETGGDGARSAAEYFRKKGIRFFLLIDEGGCVSEGMMPGIQTPLASIGIAEKGYADIELECTASGGHSSMPPLRTSLGILSQTLYDIEGHRFPCRFPLVTRQFLSALRPHTSFPLRLALSNLWLFKPLVMRVLSKYPAGNAMVRTTTAVTMASGSDAPNVLPVTSTGTVNFRLLPGYSIEDIEAFVHRQIQDRPINFRSLRCDLPSQVTSIDSDAYKLIEKTVSQVFPDAVTAPYLMTGGTDAKKYDDLCSGICRFSPYRLSRQDIDSMHSTNERISLENIETAMQFYLQLFANLDRQATDSQSKQPSLP